MVLLAFSHWSVLNKVLTANSLNLIEFTAVTETDDLQRMLFYVYQMVREVVTKTKLRVWLLEVQLILQQTPKLINKQDTLSVVTAAMFHQLFLILMRARNINICSLHESQYWKENRLVAAWNLPWLSRKWMNPCSRRRWIGSAKLKREPLPSWKKTLYFLDLICRNIFYI